VTAAPRLLILSWSRTGNNRLLAHALASRLGATHEEIRTKGWRTFVSMILDMARDRRPKVQPIRADVASFDHVLFVAPLWDMNIAHPMKTALEMLAPRLTAYSFVTLCGYHRPGQLDHIGAELSRLTGCAPAHVMELQVADLFSPADRNTVRKITPRRVKADELAVWSKQLDEIGAWFGQAVESPSASRQRGDEVPEQPL
jgi:NAD(P)H-dependent FMN reductase